ncbi:MAG: metal-dependent transcriptional regulator [Oscillospiraceae bacterium]|nr:metal-dependent transcriptional regulator [Oscillospiraceae bacterium]
MSGLYESGENYLETILILQNKGMSVRSVDVANELSFSKPSVSRAVGILKSGGFIEVSSDGYITLTETGKEVAGRIYERHLVLSKWLMDIGVDEKTAAEDACRIKHVISEKSFAMLKDTLI